MKEFILKVVAFCGIVLLVIGGACVAEIAAEVRAYRREVIAPAGASVLLCNDSQLAHGVDPSACPDFFNFSTDGLTLDQAYLRMLDVLDAPGNKDRIRQVVFDVSPASLAWLAGNPVGNLDFSGKYFLIYLLHARQASEMRSFDGWLRVARVNLVGRRLRHFWRAIRGKCKLRSSLCGGFVSKAEVGLDAPVAFAGTVSFKRRQSEGFDRVAADGFAYRILSRVVAAAHSRGVELVFITTPWHPDLIRACGEEPLGRFERTLSAFASAHRCRYENFLRMEFAPTEWLDANHLNASGAKRFARILWAALKGDGSGCGKGEAL